MGAKGSKTEEGRREEVPGLGNLSGVKGRIGEERVSSNMALREPELEVNILGEEAY